MNALITSHGQRSALTTALLAVMAAVSSLMSTHESDRAMQLKIEGSDRWAYYQAKSIKELVTTDAQEKGTGAGAKKSRFGKRRGRSTE